MDADSVTAAVYRKDGRREQQFLSRMKEALKLVAQANDERNESFPLNLQKPIQGLSRLSTYLHLFHHQVRNLGPDWLTFEVFNFMSALLFIPCSRHRINFS